MSRTRRSLPTPRIEALEKCREAKLIVGRKANTLRLRAQPPFSSGRYCKAPFPKKAIFDARHLPVGVTEDSPEVR
jgi:hypothetical protein